MLRALTSFFGQAGDAVAPAAREHELKLATAVLLIELARADFAFDDAEVDAIAGLLGEHLELNPTEVETLIAEALRQADHAACLQAFTRQLHEELEPAEKHCIVEMLWRLALADGRLDKHEDHLIRQVAGLLYVPHGELIRIRNRVAGGAH